MTAQQQMELTVIMPCEDCGKPAKFELFGLYFCQEHEPKPVELKMADWLDDDWWAEYMAQADLQATYDDVAGRL